MIKTILIVDIDSPIGILMVMPKNPVVSVAQIMPIGLYTFEEARIHPVPRSHASRGNPTQYDRLVPKLQIRDQHNYAAGHVCRRTQSILDCHACLIGIIVNFRIVLSANYRW